MKKVFLLLILSPTLSFGQLKEFLTNIEPNLQTWVKNSDSSKAVDQLKSDGLLDDYRLDGDPSANFHLVDFDADGLTDVLFYGYTGSESKDVIFFRNTGKQYKEVFSVLGKLVYINPFKPFEPLSFAIVQYGCCASINDVFEFYTPTNIGSEFGFELTNKIAHIQGMEFPINGFINPVAFKTINPEYTMRIKPIINNGEPYHPDYPMPGNTMAIYPPGSVGTAIAEKTDGTGRIWYFAIMRNNIEPIKHILFKGYNNDQPYFTMGWISSRYVEKL